MLYKTVVAQDFIWHFIVYEPKQILTWGSDSTWLGEIWEFHSPSLPVCGALSVNSDNMDQTCMSNVTCLCELTVVIPQLPCLLMEAKAVSSTVELVNSVTSDSVHSIDFAMLAFASKYPPIELVPYSDGWQRTWWQTTHMMPRLLGFSILQCKYNRHKGACPDLFQATECFEPTFIEAHHASKMICTVRSLKSWIKTCSFLEEIIPSSGEVCKEYKSNITVGSW